MDISYSKAGDLIKSIQQKNVFLFSLFKYFLTNCSYPQSNSTFTDFSKPKRKSFVWMWFWLDLLGLNEPFFFEVVIRYSRAGDLIKSMKKKKCFFIFFIEEFSDKLQLSAKQSDLYWFLWAQEKKLCADVWFWLDFLGVNMHFLWGGYQIYQSGGPEKIDPKKKSFFNFYSPIVSQQAVLFHKTFRTMVLSLRSNEYILVQNLTRPPPGVRI